MDKSMNDQYAESTALLMHRIGELESQVASLERNTSEWVRLNVRISWLKSMLDDVCAQANGAKEYPKLWGENA